ncbi:hypothetical protein AGR2A_Cc20073 [Agrobacterium genomosp. 2 str. CFBP 5494]|uniref:Uncharacterized protein n=1 Tax=Agrobacterium genomosp. 2 str. CFBP 5494 TaxID=1183436 RepID=A0A9W5B120_9HYPH|nr:hypothetical protein AGR2A_Cc20073 [Agrobacterium genomosp. 2 str. CFBP 5494]
MAAGVSFQIDSAQRNRLGFGCFGDNFGFCYAAFRARLKFVHQNGYLRGADGKANKQKNRARQQVFTPPRAGYPWQE